MSQAEEDAGLMGDALAELVELGHLTDLDVLLYFSGDKVARKKVNRALEEVAGDYGHES